ncbi:MAG: ISL3 family transposase [Candidatus Nanopelagicales bacterium]|nr:ISL3 family transposase [Candidatus Nanopelagicales bacterium]
MVTDDTGASACPVCGVFSDTVRQYRTTRPKDLGYGEEPLAVRWHKTQYACREQSCPRKAFTECVREIPAGARATGRLRRAAADAVAAGASVAAAVREHGLSWPIVHAAFVAKADAQLVEPRQVRVLGIDETRRGRPRWSKDPISGKWLKLDTFETNFFDLDGDGGLLGQASGRTKQSVIAWLDARGQEWKDSVRVVAIDPSATYRAAIQQALPNAIIVADHFHLVMLANKMITGVRQRVVRETRGRRGLATDPIWAGRRRLLRGRETLSEQAFAAMWNGLIEHDPTNQILTAWIAKEELRALFATARTGGQRHDIAHRLDRFYSWCAGPGADIPEVQRLAGTIDAWWPQILAFLQTGITNAATEGGNHLIKDAARVAFGFRNLENQRRRVRWACTRRQRLAATG